MWSALLTAAALLVLFLLKRHFDYWKRRGVPGPGFVETFKGTFEVFFRQKSFGQVFTEIYRKYEGYPYVGIFSCGFPVLLVRDPAFIKCIVSTDFNSFGDNGAAMDKKLDPIMGRNPFFLNGEEWKTTRSQLTPGFTSGKMKFVFPLVQDVCNNLVEYLKKNTKKLSAKEVCTRFTIDSVATSAFGLHGKSFEADDTEFQQIASGFLGSSNNVLLFTIAFIAPEIFSLFKLKAVPKHIEDKLIDIVSSTMKYRKENNVTRNDFLQFIMQLKDSVENFTEIDATAHAASFFADGYETSSVVLSVLLFELAAHPEAQQQLRDEINESLEKNEGKFTYEGLQELKYLEACTWESLRKNSVLPISIKVCTNSFKYTSESGDFKTMSVTVEKGTKIFLPIEGIHTDPKYFEDPQEYQPERMLNKDNFSKYTLMPFGVGQRACLGQRFGLLQIKLAVAYIVKNFEISVNEDTVLPPTPEPWHFMYATKHPFYLDFNKI